MKLFCAHHEGIMGNRCVVAFIHDHDTSWSQYHASAALSPRKEVPEPVEKEAERAPPPAWMVWRRKNVCARNGIMVMRFFQPIVLVTILRYFD